MRAIFALPLTMLLTACSGAGGEVSTQATTPVTSQWGIYFSTNMPSTLDAENSFVFPAPPGSVHYVLRRATEPDRGRIRFHYRIDGNAQFVSTQDGGAGQVTLIIQRKGDDLGASKASYRFWYLPDTTTLAPGDFTVTAPLDSSQWTNVFGQYDAAGFRLLLEQLGNVGFTFGNPRAGATGHGAHVVNGSASFTLLEYVLQ